MRSSGFLILFELIVRSWWLKALIFSSCSSICIELFQCCWDGSTYFRAITIGKWSVKSDFKMAVLKSQVNNTWSVMIMIWPLLDVFLLLLICLWLVKKLRRYINKKKNFLLYPWSKTSKSKISYKLHWFHISFSFFCFLNTYILGKLLKTLFLWQMTK